MSTLIVIPARQGSTRFPGKPMAKIRGVALLERVWKIAQATRGVDRVLIATDHTEIQTFAQSFGAEVVMTRPECSNGTERVWDAIKKLKGKKTQIAINLQGDAVLTPPWIIEATLKALKKDPKIQVATPAQHLSWEQFEEFEKLKRAGRSSGTLTVFDKKKNALYFSKNIIPNLRDRTPTQESPYYRHIGLYAYRFKALQQYVKLKPTLLEEAEKLEQLRALENGIPIRVVPVDFKGRTSWSIDHPEDIQTAEQIIAREGELIP